MKDKIIFNWLEPERKYDITTASGKKVSEIVDEYIEKHDVHIALLTDDDYKTLWKHRTEINGLKNDIASARKQTVAVMISPLTTTCLELEKKLQDVSDRLTDELNAFKPKEEKPKTKSVITIVLPIDDEQVAQVEKYLQSKKIVYVREDK